MSKPRKQDWSKLDDATLVEVALPNWQTLNHVLGHLTRRQVAVLLVAELRANRRDNLVVRLHQRLARLRTSDESKQLLKMGDLPASLIGAGLGWLQEELSS